MNRDVGPYPAAPTALAAARQAVAAAMAQASGHDGYQAARAVLASLEDADLLEVATTLAAVLGRPAELVVTADEWRVLAKALEVEP